LFITLATDGCEKEQPNMNTGSGNNLRLKNSKNDLSILSFLVIKVKNNICLNGFNASK
jgi:hypothetical protein